ncbi:uncharacterized protein LOC34617369 [Cyclospora cayetanensis]|uniref:Uncharacterized protein LOC34617369 n=1 Tax=Cyclospora cayetanensis TaxID=88456 RepID=A0A6P6RVX2_9EIME|nr:uncharacterized protein LOC34617369 [Cyclospora cayetanensis]
MAGKRCGLAKNALQGTSTQMREWGAGEGQAPMYPEVYRHPEAGRSDDGYRSAQEAERGVDTLAKRLPDLLVTICRKATAIGKRQKELHEAAVRRCLCMQRVLFLGGSHASSAGPRDEADDVSVEPQQRGPAATGGRSLGAPDIVFFKCPLTQEQFRLPVSQRWHLDDASGVCPHVFEEEAILHVM